MTTLLILLSSSIFAILVPNACATEITAQQKAITFLTEAVDLDVNTYVASLNKENISTLGGHPQKEVNFNLNSNEGGLRVMCTFVDNKLRQIYLSDYSGKLVNESTTTNSLNMADDFLERLQSYTTNSFYGELKSMLNNVSY